MWTWNMEGLKYDLENSPWRWTKDQNKNALRETVETLERKGGSLKSGRNESLKKTGSSMRHMLGFILYQLKL